ncbi:hypothetical protein [Polaromonas sp. CG9_12]|nr:hypothetical protein [Polaromonas sp. CG9_12]
MIRLARFFSMKQCFSVNVPFTHAWYVEIAINLVAKIILAP